MVNRSQKHLTESRTTASEQDQETAGLQMTLQEELEMLEATRTVIRHEVTNLPNMPNVEREASMIRVAGNIFCDFLEGRCDRIRSKIQGASNDR